MNLLDSVTLRRNTYSVLVLVLGRILLHLTTTYAYHHTQWHGVMILMVTAHALSLLNYWGFIQEQCGAFFFGRIACYELVEL
jgi:hypothetical protein